MPTCPISAIAWPSPVVNQFEPRNCRRAVIKRIGWIASGSVNAPILTAIAPRFSPASASAGFAAAAVRAGQSPGASTPRSSLWRWIQAAHGAWPSGRNTKRITHELTRRMRKKTEIALEGSSAAQHRLARAAIRTHPAGEPRIDVNTIAHGDVGDLTPDLRDHAGGVEPNARGQRRQVIPQPAAEDRVHVGNDAARLHPNQHIARTWRRNFHRTYPQALPKR